MTVEIFDPFGKNVGSLDFGQYMIENNLIVPCAQKSIRYLELKPELFVGENNMVGFFDNQNASGVTERNRRNPSLLPTHFD
jgi:hypothetical protein